MKKAEAISILATSIRPREAKDRARYDEAVKMVIEALKCSETPKSSERTSETAQADHIADIGKKVDMMHEYIYKIVKDCDGVNCYIKQGKIIRCKDCKHKHVENMVWTCPFGLSGGENFFCGYGTEPYKGE